MANDHDPSHTDQALERMTGRLPHELEPPAEVWPRIAARLATPSELPIEALARRLPAERSPPAGVWAGVAARIDTRRKARRATWLGAAVVVVALAVWLGVANRGPLGVTAWDARTVENGAAREEPDTLLGAESMLRASDVSADVTAALLGNLALVQTERLAIEQALERAPDNGDLRELWAHAYEAELGLNDIYGRTIMAYQRGSGI